MRVEEAFQNSKIGDGIWVAVAGGLSVRNARLAQELPALLYGWDRYVGDAFHNEF